MTLRDLSPWRSELEPLSDLRRSMDSLFEDFWRSNNLPIAASAAALAPAVNLSENVESFRVTAELPGLDRKDVKVEIDGDLLVLSGSKTDEKEEKGREWYRRERTHGEFRRAITVPMDVDATKAVAAMTNGVLTVEIPKRPEAMQKHRVLEIK